MTANELTKRLLIEVPRRFPSARVWRRNVGKAYGAEAVQKAIRLLEQQQPAAALAVLRGCYPIQFGEPGEPDVDGMIGPTGRRLGIEVKVGKDRMRKEQAVCQAVYAATGCIYVVATDAVTDPVADCLDQIAVAVDRRGE